MSAPLKTENSKSKTAAVPACWRGDVQRVLITNARLERRIRAMAREIERDFRGRETVIISLLNGTVVFLADLIRQLTLPLRLDFIGVSSYGSGTESGALVFTKELRLDVRGCDVLLVDDILDTGKTMSRVLPKIRADYVGFTIPDFFVVGFGLDYAERYRNLPFIGVLHPRVYAEPSGRQE